MRVGDRWSEPQAQARGPDADGTGDPSLTLRARFRNLPTILTPIGDPMRTFAVDCG